MKHEAMARALTQLDDDLIASARDYVPKKRRANPYPRILAMAACLVLVIGAALFMQRAPAADIFIGETALEGGAIMIDAPAPMALEARSPEVQALSVPLRFDAAAEKSFTVSVSDGVLDSPIDSFPRSLSERTERGSALFTWTIDTPDETTHYTLFLDGKAAVNVRYDASAACWLAEQA